MKPLPQWAGALLRPRLISIAWLLLAVWACGLLVAGVRLESWRVELTRTLTQLNADAQFRARAPSREAVDPEWYRRKALSLLSATQRMEHDALWTVFIPGSWHAFDDIEELVQARLDREFNDIVVETVRRELYARASRITGVPLVRGTGDLQGGAECQAPAPQPGDRRLSAATEDLPEFLAVRDHVASVQQLDAAVQAFLALHYSGGNPEQLRRLVAYTLDQELPGALVHSVRMFQVGEEVNVQPALMQSRLQWATRCSLAKAMSALHTRLLNTNDLFALEQGVVARLAGLFEPGTRPLPFDRTLERYRAVHTLLEDQHLLLSKGRNDWMRSGTMQLGPAYQEVLARIEATALLGPDVVHELRNQSGAAFAEFRRQFQLAYGGQGDPGIVWLDDEQRFGLSPQRSALRQGLAVLLKARFMQEEAAGTAGKALREGGSLARVTEEARVLAAERARVLAEAVPIFPEGARPVVHRVVDARVSELIYQRAYRTLKGNLPVDPQSPLDVVAFRGQRDQVLALQALLKETGSAGLGERLVAALDGELLRRMALMQDEWRQLPLQDTRLDNFAWWQGEPLQVGQVFGGQEQGATPTSLGRIAGRLEALSRQARGMAVLGSPALENDPATLRWKQLQAELDRYKANAADSSLLRLERYAASLGELKRENCAERLAAAQPAMLADDEIAQRHLQLHHALSTRCNELRAQQAIPPAASLQ
jgi:type VI secretion system protein ImpL